VLEGKIETSGTTDQREIHSAGDLFLLRANDAGVAFRNVNSKDPAKLLMYRADENHAPGSSRLETAEETCDAGVKPVNLHFIVRDIHGRDTELNAYKGKVILLDFWATWCPPCRKQIPEFIDLYNRYEARGFVVLGVCVDESPAKVKKFVRNLKVNYPILLGGSRDDLQQAFAPPGFPTGFIIGRDGRICTQKTGLTPVDEIERAIKHLL